jgi:hypothetical protein
MLALAFDSMLDCKSIHSFSGYEKIKKEPHEIKHETKLLRIGIAVITLSVLCGVFWILAIGMID